MALVPRSSLRSLVLLVSRGKPWLSSFSSSRTAVPPSGNGTPAVQPPCTPALPDSSSQKRPPPHEELPIHPLPDPPKKGSAAIGKSSPFTLENLEQPVLLLCTVDEDPKHPTADGSSYRPEAVPGPDKPERNPRDGVGHPIPDPPIRTVLDKPSPSTPEHQDYPVPLRCTVDEHLTPDCGGSYSSTPESVPGPGRGNVNHRLPDPPRRP